MDKDSDWVIIGRFGRPHGIKGFVTVNSFTEPRDNILHYAQWYAKLDNQWKPIKCTALEVTHKFILAKIEGYPEREDVARLTHVDIAVEVDQLPPLEEGDYYWHQLIGMLVLDQKGEIFGTVTEVMETGSNDVLVVNGEKRHLIPYLPGQVVIEVNHTQRQIIVDWDMDF